MGAPSPPPPPDPIQQQKVAIEGSKEAAKIQGEYNLKALQQSQAASMIGQDSPIGTMSYRQTGTDKDGNPLYTLNTRFTPEQQRLFEMQQGGQTIAGAGGLGLMASSMPMYSNANTMMSNLFTGADSLTAARVNAALGFQQPFMQQDRAWLDNQLRNQGIMPDDPAYKRQMAELNKQQYGNQANFISSVIPQSMQDATNAYMMPLDTAAKLGLYGAPAIINQYNTPQFTSKPSDFTGAYGTSMGAQAQNYQNQMSGYNAQVGAYGNMMGGLFGIGSSALKMPGMNTFLFG